MPWWYWRVRPTLLYQVEREGRRRGRLALSALVGAAVGLAHDAPSPLR